MNMHGAARRLILLSAKMCSLVHHVCANKLIAAAPNDEVVALLLTAASGVGGSKNML
jgi:hypothetical protein